MLCFLGLAQVWTEGGQTSFQPPKDHAGIYPYQSGPLMEPGFGPSTVQGENILFWLVLGSWTFDFHDVTFIFFTQTRESQNRRPSIMIYIN